MLDSTGEQARVRGVPAGIDPIYASAWPSTHPAMMAGASNDELRERHLIGGLFAPDRVTLHYCHDDRMVVGGAMPVAGVIRLPAQSEPESARGRPLLERRELGLINVGGPGVVVVDGARHELDLHDGLFVPMGTDEVSFASASPDHPARFYLVSAVAHVAHPARRIALADAHAFRRGTAAEANERTIRQFIVPGVCASASLAMGLTILDEGSVWNTLPPHTHPRRSEVYFYFGLGDEGRVLHFMGEPNAMRHLVVADEEIVLSPPWSIHMGCGTRAYAFIWAMAGENQDYVDMNPVTIGELR